MLIIICNMFVLRAVESVDLTCFPFAGSNHCCWWVYHLIKMKPPIWTTSLNIQRNELKAEHNWIIEPIDLIRDVFDFFPFHASMVRHFMSTGWKYFSFLLTENDEKWSINLIATMKSMTVDRHLWFCLIIMVP